MRSRHLSPISTGLSTSCRTYLKRDNSLDTHLIAVCKTFEGQKNQLHVTAVASATQIQTDPHAI